MNIAEQQKEIISAVCKLPYDIWQDGERAISKDFFDRKDIEIMDKNKYCQWKTFYKGKEIHLTWFYDECPSIRIDGIRFYENIINNPVSLYISDIAKYKSGKFTKERDEIYKIICQ